MTCPPDATRPDGGEDVEWRLRPRWVLTTAVLATVWLGAWVGGLAALGALDRLVTFAGVILVPLTASAAEVWGRRLRLTSRGVESVGSVSRLSVAWQDLEGVERRHLTYAVARETIVDSGLQISMDSLVRAAPRGQRRLRLTPYVGGDRYRVLLQRLAEHRPDLVPPRPRDQHAPGA